MKKALPIIIALVLVVAGLAGVLVMVIPMPSEEYGVIDAYIDALNDCDAEAVKETSVFSALDDAFAGLMGGIEAEKGSTKKTDNKLEFLRSNASNLASILPEDVKSVEEITLISCVKKEEAQPIMNVTESGAQVSAQIEITFKNKDGKTERVSDCMDVLVMSTGDGGGKKLLFV